PECGGEAGPFRVSPPCRPPGESVGTGGRPVGLRLGLAGFRCGSSGRLGLGRGKATQGGVRETEPGRARLGIIIRGSSVRVRPPLLVPDQERGGAMSHRLSGPGALLATLFLLAASCRSPRTPPWLVERARQEADLAARSQVRHDFRFTDRRRASGITFQNRVVDDAGRSYKLAHYDHGSGVCAADVDGDGLPDLYFVTQLGTSQLWKNAGGGRFVDITAQAGLAMPDAIGVGCAFADIDNDGDPDLFVTTVRHGNRLFENLGNGTFRDITAQAGVGYVGRSSGAMFLDYDGDGLLDLFLTNVGVYTTNQRGPGGYYVALEDAFT